MPGKLLFPFKWIMAVLIIFPMLIGMACSLPTELSTAENNTAGTNSEEEIDAVGNEPDEMLNDVRFQPEGFIPESFPAITLGSISFTADTGSAVRVEVEPGDGPASAEVVDQSGLTWVLEIPGGAVERAQTIIMTPLSQINSDGLSGNTGNVVSGIRLEPDGLTFNQTLQLSVYGPGLDGPGLILSGSQTGEEVGYSLQDSTGEDPTAQIDHFSTYFVSQLQEEDLPGIGEDAWKEYKRLSDEAKKLLKTKLDIPTPPSLPLECSSEETAQKNDEIIQKFIENGLNPEYSLLEQMLNQRRIMGFTGNTKIGEDWSTEISLATRMVQKSIAMMDQYYGQEDKLLAVSRFSLTAAQKLQLLGGKVNLADKIMTKLAKWNKDLIDRLIKDIREKHNYKKFPVVWQIAYNAQFLGADVDIDEMIEKLKDSLKFELEYTFELNMFDIHNITTVVVPMQFTFEIGNPYQCEGTAEGTYSLAELLDDPESSVQVFPYPVHAALKGFDPCNDTVMIGIDQFGSEADTLTMTTEDSSETMSWPISYSASQSLFADEMGEDMYWFQLPLQNGNAIAVDQVIERENMADFTCTLTIRLIHK